MWIERVDGADGTDAVSDVGATRLDAAEWKQLDLRLRAYAQHRSALDAAEAFDLTRAEQLKIYVFFGYTHLYEYMERVLGYAPHTARERMRVARLERPGSIGCRGILDLRAASAQGARGLVRPSRLPPGHCRSASKMSRSRVISGPIAVEAAATAAHAIAGFHPSPTSASLVCARSTAASSLLAAPTWAPVVATRLGSVAAPTWAPVVVTRLGSVAAPTWALVGAVDGGVAAAVVVHLADFGPAACRGRYAWDRSRP